MHSKLVVLGLAGLALSKPLHERGCARHSSSVATTAVVSSYTASASSAAAPYPTSASGSSGNQGKGYSGHGTGRPSASGSVSAKSSSSAYYSYSPIPSSSAAASSSSVQASAASSSAASSSAASSYSSYAAGSSSAAASSSEAASSYASSSVAASSAVSSAAVTSAAVTTPAAATSAAASVSVDVPTSCTVTEFSAISDAVASCTALVLSNIAAPEAETIDLTDLQDGTTVIFSGTTTFATTADSDFNPIEISGTDITITAEEGAIIDGNGQAYWDGQGSNGGTDKPDHFIVVKDVDGGSISNLYIQNWPTHCFDITGCNDLVISGITLNNTAGDEPNSASDGDPAAHNSDGFDLSSCTDVVLKDSVVYNQDDCVAITSGDNIVVSGMYCSGGHGLSIGSVGGKSNNNVTNIVFQDSTVVNSENGCRIKSNSDTTGYIHNITYSNIYMENISDYGIDVQQDYLNGGPTGEPTNGVSIEIVSFNNVTGTATDDAYDYYILCGDGSCSDFTFTDVSITGGGETSSCNYPDSGCPSS